VLSVPYVYRDNEELAEAVRDLMAG
jgi:hypothetical protein